MKEQIVLIGGGGHCAACIDVIEAEGKLQIAGIVEKEGISQGTVLGYQVIATDPELPELAKKYRFFLITIGQLKKADKRKAMFEYLKQTAAEFPVIISPSAYVSKHTFIDEGTIIMHQALVNAGAHIGKNCIINTGAVVEHDGFTGDHCHISTGSIINGHCQIGEGTFIGSNCVIANNINIAANTVVGAGSVVIKSIQECGVYAGNPAHKLNSNA